MPKETEMPPLLEIRDLHRRYPGVHAVAGVSLQIESGSCFGLLGPNGAGKTTTIEMMEGINEPTSGEILYQGRPRDRSFEREIGIQFQSTALQEYLSVKETLNLFRGLYPSPVALDELIERCALGEFINQDNRKLSGGQRQRLLLAIALVNRPVLLFLDEPTTGLDPQARHNFWDLIGDIKAEGTTILLTTHYMEEASQLCDEIAIMDHGRVIARGKPQQLLSHHFEERLVRLPKESINDPEGLGERFIDKGDWIEIHSPNINRTIDLLLHQGCDLSQLQIRHANLEDLFLELTGRGLRQ